MGIGSILALIIGGLISTAISGAISSGTTIYNTGRNLEQEKELKLAELAQEKDLTINKYAYAVQDMKNAGLNPALATGFAGFGGDPVGDAGGSSGRSSASAASSASMSSQSVLLQSIVGAGLENLRDVNKYIANITKSNAFQARQEAKKLADKLESQSSAMYR